MLNDPSPINTSLNRVGLEARIRKVFQVFSDDEARILVTSVCNTVAVGRKVCWV